VFGILIKIRHRTRIKELITKKIIRKRVILGVSYILINNGSGLMGIGREVLRGVYLGWWLESSKIILFI